MSNDGRCVNVSSVWPLLSWLIGVVPCLYFRGTLLDPISSPIVDWLSRAHFSLGAVLSNSTSFGIAVVRWAAPGTLGSKLSGDCAILGPSPALAIFSNRLGWHAVTGHDSTLRCSDP